MADKKISALTGATTPLAGTEVLPIVQSGSTVKVAVSDLTAGRAISATQLTLTTGNLIVANGQGVDFSATPGTGTSELLADYEEGTWTPTSIGGMTGFANPEGTYTKIGRIVNVRGSFDIASVTNNVFVGGLPFTSAATLFYSIIDNNFPVAVAFKRVEASGTQIQWNVNATGAFAVTISLSAWYFAA
jgi:hypothetical protein